MNKPAGEPVTFVLQAPEQNRSQDEITLAELVQLLLDQKWVFICVLTVSLALSIAYAYLATQWYRAEVTLVPVKEEAALTRGLGALGGLSSLASIAGINLDGRDATEPLAVLKSRDFTKSFIEENNLLPILFSKQWDESAQRWKHKDPKKWPDVRDGVRYFERKVRAVDQDKNSDLVTLSIEWHDPVIASRWANLLVDKLNARMRERALHEAQTNVAYLKKELESSNVVTLQESVARLLESEMQKMMVARGSQEYSFKVVDRGYPPKWRSRPNRVLVVIVGLIGGTALAVLIAFVRHVLSKRRSLPATA